MCGRITLTSSGRELAEQFELDSHPTEVLAPRYNIAPSQEIATVFVNKFFCKSKIFS